MCDSLVLVLGRRVRRGGPKVAVGFNPSAAAEPSRQTISSRSDDRTIATPSAAQGIESLAEETMVLETISSHGNRMTCDRALQVPNRPWKLTKPQPQRGIDCHA